MNKSLGLQLIVFSILLAGLSYLSFFLSPATTRTTLIAGLLGGALCLAWGLLAVKGKRGKLLPMLTLAPVCYILIGQAIMILGGTAELPGRRTAGAVVALLSLLSMAMLMRIAYAGVESVGSAQTSPKAGEDKPASTERLAAPIGSRKRVT